jgi:hypothetical protein
MSLCTPSKVCLLHVHTFQLIISALRPSASPRPPVPEEVRLPGLWSCGHAVSVTDHPSFFHDGNRRQLLLGFVDHIETHLYQAPIDWLVFQYHDELTPLRHLPHVYYPSLFQHLGHVSSFQDVGFLHDCLCFACMFYFACMLYFA